MWHPRTAAIGLAAIAILGFDVSTKVGAQVVAPPAAARITSKAPAIVTPAPVLVIESTTPNVFGVKVRQDRPGKVMVEAVDPIGVAANAGVQVGDQVLSVANNPIDSAATFEERMRAVHPSEQVEFSFYRNGRPYNVVLTAIAPTATTTAEGASGGTATVTTVVVPKRVETADILGMFLKEAAPTLVVIERVSLNTPAAVAGLREGDVLLSVAGHPAAPLSELVPFATKLVAGRRPGEPILLEISRNDRTQTIPVLPVNVSSSATANAALPLPTQRGPAIVGLVLRDEGFNRVEVVDVAPGSPAALANIVRGDVILALDTQSIASVEQFMAAISIHCIGDTVSVQIERRGTPSLTTMALTPRLVDLATVITSQSTSEAVQQVLTLQRDLQALSLEVKTLELQLNALRKPAGVPVTAPVPGRTTVVVP
jgi:S1-C subfamily serine protease